MISLFLILLETVPTAPTENINPSTPWYDIKIIHTLIGALISIFVLVITQYITGRREKTKYKQTMLSWLTINNSSLFTLIFQYSLNESNIDYVKLREELNKVGSFIYILPNDLQIDFMDLYLIHQKDPNYYDTNKDRIFPLLVSIVAKLNKYGVEAFGNN